MWLRLLGLAPAVQIQIFEFYQAVLEATIIRARKEGKYDEGIVDVKGTSIILSEAPQVRPVQKTLGQYKMRGVKGGVTMGWKRRREPYILYL
jgi:hypothetical protein